MLAGKYESKLGKKFQVSFPKKFRSVLGDRLILTKGLEKCLLVISEEKWKTLLEGTETLPFINKSARELQRFLFGNATEVEIDNKGRFLIPEFLREYGNLMENIVFLGVDRFVEIWDKEIWEKYQVDLTSRIEGVADKLVSENKVEKIEQ